MTLLKHDLSYSYGMNRSRLDTTADAQKLEEARQIRDWADDAAMIDEALTVLIDIHSGMEIDENYLGYKRHPLEEPDKWGNLAYFDDFNDRVMGEEDEDEPDEWGDLESCLEAIDRLKAAKDE
ncbi:MAG: hypothetical protein OXH95_06510 [bacterium]|nr:hypothetical protein [bacterium]